MTYLEKLASALVASYVERVPGTIQQSWEELSLHQKQLAISQVKTVLQELQEPSDEMLDAGIKIIDDPKGFGVPMIWGAMIAEALDGPLTPDDGIPLISASHPIPSWPKRVWFWVRYLLDPHLYMVEGKSMKTVELDETSLRRHVQGSGAGLRINRGQPEAKLPPGNTERP